MLVAKRWPADLRRAAYLFAAMDAIAPPISLAFTLIKIATAFLIDVSEFIDQIFSVQTSAAGVFRRAPIRIQSCLRY